MNMNTNPAYLDATEASVRLGVTRATLYAYVSRGLLRAHAPELPSDRKSRYLLSDIERLAGERKRGRKPKEVARAALHWGTPVLESGITLISQGHLYYRGIPAVELAAEATLEEVAASLWLCDVGQAFGPEAPKPGPLWRAVQVHHAAHPTEQRLLPLFTIASEGLDAGAWEQSPAVMAQGCGALLRLVAASMLGHQPSASPIHQQCARAWKLDAEGAKLMRMALILSADHELNASSFTVRCVSSARATVRLSIIAGLAALAGVEHGGITARVEALFDELGGLRDPRPQIRLRLARGEALPGFGHPLYPHGDVRAHALLTHLLPRNAMWRRIVDCARDLTGLEPTLDVALVALRRHLELAPGTAFGIFALGRTVGWIAHALEQRECAELIRPRATYTGPLPRQVETDSPRRTVRGRR
jgi:citrate synthase